ncbi:beta-glucosidase [Olsenella profusa]|uniref:Glycoside hydrolase family 3 C-terminal domain-containing protein n=1 Tax=Olsenella profusa TaxID=138595 RepID=A0ABS2F1N8_9ACTN|nr:glycoside hydrolase family 3 C-terminal domain-containing protein [Olsenella profusa]MBM6774748.1 glycoside hydrolase family 3 C-terminal domain-containing protein [Olsenella profusa]
MRRMKSGVTRRGFVLGTAAAAVMAGLAGCTPGSEQGEATSGESVAPAAVTDNLYYESEYDYTAEGEQKLVDDGMALGSRIVAEGTVLLRNEGSALPISPADGKIMAFGNAGPSMMTGFDAAAKDAGFDFDDASWEFYTNGSTYSNSWQVNENPWADVEASGILDSASGVAIVFLGRRDHEGCDAQWYVDHDYLALSQEEKDMLNEVAALRRDGTFSKMIVAVTTSNTISWEDGDWSDAIDALLWFGNITSTGYGSPLAYGCPAFVDVLSGAANPSGRLADTIYKDNQANPVMANFGRIDADLSQVSDEKLAEVQAESDKWQPGQFYGNHWRHDYVYAEGIYVGYRYPETRYEDKVLGQGNAGDFDYASYVAYPFGYGLSYTSFSYSDFAVEEGDDAFTVTVTVTNDGQVAGRHAALVFVQNPYTDYDRENGVEKASVELKGYEKTQELEPGASETLTITVSKHELATYDANTAKTYVLEDGDYYFTVAGSAHDAVNNVLAAKGKTTADGMTADGDDSLVWVWSSPDFDADTYSVSAQTGVEITNLFDDVDPNKNPLMSENNSITWLSRSDWEGTFPKEASRLVYTDAIADLAKPITYQGGSGDASSVPTHEFGTSGSLKLVDMKDKDYDDGDWEKFVSQMSYEDMVDFINEPEAPVTSLGKPGTTAGNGSSGWFGAVFTASGICGFIMTSKETVTNTFSSEIHELAGKLTGETMLHSSTVEDKNVSLYGWSCDTHRAPYSGRNWEYYSEDPYLGGRSCAEETKAIVDKGCLVYTKHCAGNDQEEYRHGVPSWGNEQAWREIYFRQFEKAIVEGGANGVMSGFNRLGINWTGENRAFLVDWLEGELGYKGITITDQFEAPQMDSPDGLLNGTHLWLGTTSDNAGRKNCHEILLRDEYKNDPVVQDALFEAVHRVMYNYAHSFAVNGLTSDYVFTGNLPIATAVSVADDTQVSAPVSFYGDKTFVAARSAGFFDVLPKTSYHGTWDYTEDGLTMTMEDGCSVSAPTVSDGFISWELTLEGGAVAPGSIAQYDLVSACNSALGTSFDTGEQPTYQLSFSAGDDAATGDAPAAMDIHNGVAVTIPECPFTLEGKTFAGWLVGGSVVAAGAEYVPSGYEDVAAEATWTVVPLCTATTKDAYFYSEHQSEGIPMALYADGTVKLCNFHSFACSGTWEVEGSGSGAGTLVIKNEKGEAVAAKESDGEMVYEQEGLVYDWHQPNQGYGDGTFPVMLTHRISLDDLLSAYNDANGTSYDSLDVEEGSAEFELAPTGEPLYVDFF